MPAVDDFKSFNRLDQTVLGAGVLAFILSLFHVFVSSVSGPGASVYKAVIGDRHATAWHNWGFFAMLLIVVATALAAARLFAASSLPQLPVGINLLTFALSALAFLCLIIAWFHNSSSVNLGGGAKASVHLGIAGYLLLLASLAQAAAAFLLFRSSGETTPDFKAMSNRSSAPTAPPAYGSTPPPPAGAPASSYPATPAGDYTLDDQPPAPTP